jgi:cyanophycinase
MNKPKGKLIPIGGSEARSSGDQEETNEGQKVNFLQNGILKQVLEEIKGTDSRMVIVPAASEIPEEMGSLYIDAFKMLGCTKTTVVYIADRDETDKESNLKALAEADGVLFTGGNQDALVEKLAGTKFLSILIDRYHNEPFVVAGTSAGAAAMAKLMIKEGKSGEPLLKGMVETDLGLGLLPPVIIDTHFMQRSRLPRLTEALLRNPSLIGMGLCQDAGVVITEGNRLRSIGSGGIFIIETDDIVDTNYHEIDELESVYLNNLKVHVLAQGAGYIIDERRFVAAEMLAPKTDR